jgi:hypothetical protein
MGCLDIKTFSQITNGAVNEFHDERQMIYCSSSAGIYDRFSFISGTFEVLPLFAFIILYKVSQEMIYFQTYNSQCILTNNVCMDAEHYTNLKSDNNSRKQKGIVGMYTMTPTLKKIQFLRRDYQE